MGCKGSKDENPEEIKSEMEKTKIPDIDAIFEEAATILGNCEDIRSGCTDTVDEMNTLANTNLLKEGNV